MTNNRYCLYAVSEQQKAILMHQMHNFRIFNNRDPLQILKDDFFNNFIDFKVPDKVSIIVVRLGGSIKQ